MGWIETKYITLLSSRLDKFKKKYGNLYNFRCNICGDSAKNKNKARGYLYERGGEYWMSCHNCNISMPFKAWLKQTDTGLYEEYCFERLKTNNPNPINEEPIKLFKKFDIDVLNEFQTISELKLNHPARQYFANRQLPPKFARELYWCLEFKLFTNSLIPDKFVLGTGDEGRLIIPLLSVNNKLVGYQGRSIKSNEEQQLRYITIVLVEDAPRIWGANHCDFNRKFYVFEGPFDAMFIPNAIAACGGKVVSDLYKLGCNINNAVVCYDCEPRNKDILEAIHKTICAGYKVCIWPNTIRSKDINKMVMDDNLSPQQIVQIIDSHTYSGLEAHIHFNEFKKKRVLQ
jgi:hypothetical protein